MTTSSQTENDKQEQFEIVNLKNGLKSLRSLANLETFHPVTGPRVESRILYVESQNLIERWRGSTTEFVIWDVGFGAGANVTAVIEAIEQELSKGQQSMAKLRPIRILSFDRSTAPIEFALKNVDSLDYLKNHEAHLLELLSSRRVRLHQLIDWQLILSDFSQLVFVSNSSDWAAPHAILFDPYSAYKNSEMWSLELFTALRGFLPQNEVSLLTNYTRSTSVRVTLLLAGFFVGVGTEVGEKSETTVASNQLAALYRPLTRDWLKRVECSRNSAPIRASGLKKDVPISKEDFAKLLTHPQFS